MAREVKIYLRDFFICCFIFTCLQFAFTACQNQPTWQQQYDLGMRYLTESNYEEAIMAFTKAIDIDPEHTDSYVYLIQAYLSSGNQEDAELVRASGYEATGDQRLSCDVSGGWIFYDSSIPPEQRITYRDFELFSDIQQRALHQFVAALTSQDITKLWEIEQEVNLPVQFDTTVDGYRMEFSSIDSKDFPEYYLTWMNHLSQQNGENPLAAFDADLYIGLEKMIVIEIRPENGNGYAYSGIQNMIGTDGETFMVTQRADSLQVAACKEWQYDGPWSSYAEILHVDGAEQKASTRMEAEGTAKQGKKNTDTMSLISYDDEVRTVQEFQNGEMTSYYIESSDGEKIDLMEMMQGVLDFAEETQSDDRL